MRHVTLTDVDGTGLDQYVLIPMLTDVQVDDLLPIVADPTRWRILHLLAREELCTTHLQDLLGAKQTLVSHHMKVLRDAGLVDTAPCGRFTYFRLRAGAFDAASEAMRALAAASHELPTRRAC